MGKKQLNRVKAVLADKGKSNKELAELLSLSEQTISLCCTNNRRPSLEALYNIAEVLDIDVRELLVPNRPI